MTNLQVLGDFVSVFTAIDPSVDVQEGLRDEWASEVRWREEVLTKSTRYKMILAKTAGCSVPKPRVVQWMISHTCGDCKTKGKVQRICIGAPCE